LPWARQIRANTDKDHRKTPNNPPPLENKQILGTMPNKLCIVPMLSLDDAPY
jgi:hypothetical protein